MDSTMSNRVLPSIPPPRQDQTRTRKTSQPTMGSGGAPGTFDINTQAIRNVRLRKVSCQEVFSDQSKEVGRSSVQRFIVVEVDANLIIYIFNIVVNIALCNIYPLNYCFTCVCNMKMLITLVIESCIIHITYKWLCPVNLLKLVTNCVIFLWVVNFCG